MVIELRRRLAQRSDFGVRARVAGENRRIEPAPRDRAVRHHHRTDGNLAALARFGGGGKCHAHELHVLIACTIPVTVDDTTWCNGRYLREANPARLRPAQEGGIMTLSRLAATLLAF